MGRMFRRLRRWFKGWLDCRRKRCGYYRHYLAYGPADMPHRTYHLQDDMAVEHMRTCERSERTGTCRTCEAYERRLRA